MREIIVQVRVPGYEYSYQVSNTLTIGTRTISIELYQMVHGPRCKYLVLVLVLPTGHVEFKMQKKNGGANDLTLCIQDRKENLFDGRRQILRLKLW